MGEVTRREQETERVASLTERPLVWERELEEEIWIGGQEGRVLLQEEVPGDERGV